MTDCRQAELFLCLIKWARMHGLWEEMVSSVFSPYMGLEKYLYCHVWQRWIYSQFIPVLAAQLCFYSHLLMAFPHLRSHTQIWQSAEKLMVDFKILMLFNALGNVVQWSCHAGSASYQTGALGMFSKWYFYLVLAGGLRATSVQCIWPWCWGLHQHKNCHFQLQPNQKLQWEDLSSPDFFRVMC